VVYLGSKLTGSHDEVTGKGFKHLTPTSEALETVMEQVTKRSITIENVPVLSALGRVLSHDLMSPSDIPPFDRAAMDGFAVRAEDTYGASVSSPILLQTIGAVGIGVNPTVSVRKGDAAFVVTGGQMPQGANAVVMVEYTEQTKNGSVEVSGEVHPAENVSKIGEDVRKGTVVLKEGTRLLPQDIGMLSYLQLTEISVKRRLKIAVLSTGNEIQERPGSKSGKIPDVNRPTLLSAIRELGCEPIDIGIARDEFSEIQGKLRGALETSDIILATAGTSVGPGDMVPRVIDSLGKPGMLVHGVAMRPSMPTGLAVVNGRPIVSLPGYPASAYLAFLEFVPPLVRHLLGTHLLPRPKVEAKLRRRVAGVLGSKTYVRVQVSESGGSLFVDPVRTSGAGILSSLVQANGFIIVPEHVEGYEEGQTVEVELFRPVEREQPD
jgi:molybdenum cofactor synthesis domain-containing protein